jgi:hypothetical protein
MNAFGAWSQLYANLYGARTDGTHPKAKNLINLILNNDNRVLHERSQELNAITQGSVSVLPPDTRHVDYEIIPLFIADGCLYHCSFCCVQSPQKFQTRKKSNILDQIQKLKRFYGRNLINYHALFLGNHDALAADDDLIYLAASEATALFNSGGSYSKRPTLFLFASVGSVLDAKPQLFDRLNHLLKGRYTSPQ